MRRKAKVDGNHAEIVAAFRKAGWSVQSLASVGRGCPDLIVAHPAVDVVVTVHGVSGRKYFQRAPVDVRPRLIPLQLVR